MCELTTLATGLSLLGTAAIGAKAASSVQAPTIETYTPEAASQAIESTRPDAPTAAPVMAVPGQKSAEDQQRDALSGDVRSKRKGRAALRIDRNTATPAYAAGSGIAAPAG